MSEILYHDDEQKITDLLMGRKVTKVADDKLFLDNDIELTFVGHDGGCGCSAGCYDLAELNDADNVITRVEFESDPSGDEFADDAKGHYKIFVYAGHDRINLATFEGSDGNGYYGTGYEIRIRRGLA